MHPNAVHWQQHIIALESRYLSGWRLEGGQIVEFGTVEGLYRCDRSAGGNVVDLVDVESFENEKNTENVEITENNENVNDAEKTGKAPKGGSSG